MFPCLLPQALLECVVEDMGDTILAQASQQTADDVIQLLMMGEDGDKVVMEELRAGITDRIQGMGEQADREEGITLKLKVRDPDTSWNICNLPCSFKENTA